MPPRPQKAAMSAEQLDALIAAAGHAGTSNTALAALVGFSRVQWWRLRTGKTNISQRSADLIRSKLRPPKKRNG